MSNICAVIPAAGRGSRLGLEFPKILAPICDNTTIIDVMLNKLLRHVDAVNIIVSPTGFKYVTDHLISRNYPIDRISLSIQDSPSGMGDAIFCGYDTWAKYEKIFVIWGDQVFLSDDTITKGIKNSLHSDLLVPLAMVNSPYVQYILDDGVIKDILQSREGDKTALHGLSDIGAFILQVKGLKEEWEKYLFSASLGNITGELNFLPFIKQLSTLSSWRFSTFFVDDAREARGVNTPEDLLFFQNHFNI
jgi:bifunctional UDP-N-acetylglucosamine pyrophosphorylase/glucosamine-1-phosphate N-acetyltransferase